LNIRRAYRVWQRHLTVYKKLYRSSIAINFIEPFLYLVALGLGLGGFVSKINGQPYINYLAPGVIASSAMFAAAYECSYGTYIRMTFQKTFDAILATPVTLDDLVLAEMLWGATKSLIYGVIIMLVVSVMGLIDSPLLVLSTPFLFLSGIIMAEIAIMYDSVIPGIDYFNYFFTIFITPLFLFSGIFFPLDGLPHVVSVIAFFTPLYHTVNITRGLASGALPIWDMLWLIVAAVVLAPFVFKMMRRRVLEKPL